MSSVLEEICAQKRANVEQAKRQKPFDVIHAEALKAPSVRGFERSLRMTVARHGFGVIAEIKKASPSAGIIRPDFDPASLAQAYAQAGAACLSVLTDEPYFKGRNADLTTARGACSLPVLRKDFIVDPWQVAESRAIGADAILLILAALDDATAASLYDAARRYDMDVLVEVHDADELQRALKLPSPLIGVNSRNLKTMTVDLKTAASLIHDVPADRLAISESGVKTPEDIAVLRKAGAKGFLIGESLLKQQEVGPALKHLLVVK